MKAKNIQFIAKMFTIASPIFVAACAGDLNKLGGIGLNIGGSAQASGSVTNTVTPTPVPPATRSFNLNAPNGTSVYVGQRPHAQFDINRYEFISDTTEDLWSLYARCSNDTKPATYAINADSPKLFDIYCPEATESLVGSSINLAAWLQGKKYNQASSIATLSYIVSLRATPTPAPTATPAPTPTPSPSPTPAPTATPAPTPTPSPSPTAGTGIN